MGELMELDDIFCQWKPLSESFANSNKTSSFEIYSNDFLF